MVRTIGTSSSYPNLLNFKRFSHLDHCHDFECFAAEIEATFCDEMARSRSKWEKLLKTSFGQNAQNWVKFAELEVRFGEIENARKIFRKGVQFSKFNSSAIFEKAANFERIYGSIKELEEMENLTKKKVLEIERRELREQNEKEKAKERREKVASKFDQKSKVCSRPLYKVLHKFFFSLSSNQ